MMDGSHDCEEHVTNNGEGLIPNNRERHNMKKLIEHDVRARDAMARCEALRRSVRGMVESRLA